jgi:hypothetical protein
MPIVVNATQEEITIKIVGNYFKFGPGKSKTMNPDLAMFIQTSPGAKGCGLAVLPDLYQEGEEIDDVTDADMKARRQHHEDLKKEACENALTDYIDRYRQVIHNNQVSLKQDLAKTNNPADPAAYISKGELEAMRLVAKYQKRAEDATQDSIDEVKRLMKNVTGNEK